MSGGELRVKENAMNAIKKGGAAALGLLLAVASLPVWAQTTRDDVEVMLELVQLERKAVVAENMELTAEESEAFWPVYNDYAQKLRELNQRDAKLVLDYAKAFATLTDETAAKLLKEAQAIDKKRVKIRTAYAKKLRRVLPARKVARAYQVESKIDAIIEFDMARSIPLAR
jgi:hypothetical protein